MNKYLKLLKFEFKNIIRDKMTVVMIVYPIMFIIVASYVLPLILDEFGDGGPGQRIAALVMIIIFASIAPFITSALLGFVILDNKDENTLDTIRVTPITLKGYITFKSIYGYILSVNASFWIIAATKFLSRDGYTIMGENLFDRFSIPAILVYALVAALFTPVFALLLGALAKNKIEGFAYMKTMGMFVILPALVVIDTMQDAKQYILGIIPIFWPVKALMTQAGFLDHSSNLPPWGYMVVGIVYMLGLTILTYKLFQSKIQS